MNWYANLRTRTKLLGLFSVVVLLLILQATFTYRSLHTIEEIERGHVDPANRAMVDVMMLSAAQNRIRGEMLTYLLSRDQAQRATLRKDVDEQSAQISDRIAALRRYLTERVPQALPSLLAAERDISEYRGVRQRQFDLVAAGKEADAEALSTTDQSERFERIRGAMADLSREIDAVATADTSHAARLFEQTVRIQLTGATAAVLVALLMVWLMNRSLRNTSRELQGGIEVLGSASSEMLTTVSEIVAGAAETATAVSETSTTAEELKQTAHLSNEKATAVQDAALKTAAVSESGRRAVGAAIDGMGQIREQMETIAECVVRLSEQSQTISEIIATVNDLAEQSNLLAVNAAIEATRAGEYGKGFSVVAQEVKSLAEQSREATTQVRSILLEAQKATSAVVMATEQGTRVVAAGVKQATDAGDAILGLTQNVTQAALAANQIAASTKQELVGVDQIAQALSSINQAATQNTVATKQLETSARHLQSLGERLKELVDR